MSEKKQLGLRGIAGFACGILGLFLFMWTPKTGIAIAVYFILLALCIVLVGFLIRGQHTGYWPDKPDHL